MGYRLNRLDEPVFMAGPKPMQTEVCIHHRLESYAFAYLMHMNRKFDYDIVIVSISCVKLRIIESKHFPQDPVAAIREGFSTTDEKFLDKLKTEVRQVLIDHSVTFKSQEIFF